MHAPTVHPSEHPCNCCSCVCVPLPILLPTAVHSCFNTQLPLAARITCWVRARSGVALAVVHGDQIILQPTSSTHPPTLSSCGCHSPDVVSPQQLSALGWTAACTMQDVFACSKPVSRNIIQVSTPCCLFVSSSTSMQALMDFSTSAPLGLFIHAHYYTPSHLLMLVSPCR